MKQFFVGFVASAFTMLLIDAVWLGLMMKPFYMKYLSHLVAKSPNLVPAILFYIIYNIGIVLLVILPSLSDGRDFMKVFVAGAILGLTAYATYDLTNHATMKNWPAIVSIVDIIWGTVLTGVVSTIAVFVTRMIR